MSDLIDRQAAIDAIEQMQMPIMRSEFSEEQFVFTGMSEALQAIKDLPSAQPERCEECENFSKTRLLIPQPEQWIPCSERLPEAQTEVIVSCTDDSGDTKFRYTSSGWVTTNKEY